MVGVLYDGSYVMFVLCGGGYVIFVLYDGSYMIFVMCGGGVI